jgi:hypothetical protein
MCFSAVVDKHADGDIMKQLMTLSLAAVFAFSTSMACAQSKRGQKWLAPNERWLGPDQAIGGAGATPGPGGGNTSVTTGQQAFGANGNPNLPVPNLSGTGPSTSGGGAAGGGGAGGGGGGGMR